MRRRALAVPAGLLLLLSAGCGTEPGDRAGDAGPHNAADVTFAQEMVPHHRQAVRMADLAEGHDLDPEVRDLVEAIGTAQSGEVEEMTGWLESWGEPVPGEDSGAAMQGMLTGSELDQLADAPDPAFQRLWLVRMVGHHQGAIPMAQAELDHGRSPQAIELAREVIRTQKAELREMGGLIGQ